MVRGRATEDQLENHKKSIKTEPKIFHKIEYLLDRNQIYFTVLS